MKVITFCSIVGLAVAVCLMMGCDQGHPEISCGVVKRTVEGTGGFWGTGSQTAVDLGDRVVTASGGRALISGDHVCVQLRSEGGPFITSDGAHQ